MLKLLIALSIIQSLQANYQITTQMGNKTFTVFNGNEFSFRFNPSSMRQSTCHPSPLFMESPDQESRDFIIHNQDAENLTLMILTTTLDNKVASLVNPPQLLDPRSSIQILANDSQTLTLYYTCDQTQQTDKTWTYVEVHLIRPDKIEIFDYIKLCKPPVNPFHPLLILTSLSILLVIIGSIYGQKEIVLMGEVQKEEFGAKTAITFIFMASGALMVLFYFPTIATMILQVWISVVSTISITTILTDFMGNSSGVSFRLPIIKKVKITQAFSFIIAVVFVACYLREKNWILSNVLSLANTLMMFRMIEIDSLRTAYLLLFMAFFYDIFWVFYSDAFFGQSVMATVATSIDLPMKFSCPSFLPSPTQPLERCSLIGLGDIILPGIMLKFIYKAENILGSGYWVFITGCVGYAMGIGCCMAILIVFQTAQPALLYLVPFTLIPIAVTALKRGVFGMIWKREIRTTQSKPVENFRDYELASESM